MRILFVTTMSAKKQGDLLEVGILHGLRSLLGKDCIDYPRKKIMYHDWSETKKEDLHGMGFSLLTESIKDISTVERHDMKNIDVVLYGNVGQYDYGELEYINSLVAKQDIWYLDSHDLYGYAPKMIEHPSELGKVIGIQKKPCFKRELLTNQQDVYPTGLCIPSSRIRKFDLQLKEQWFQKTAPDVALFRTQEDLGNRKNYKFEDEEEYMQDLQKSWFGLTCKRGGWDALRHYEILASGALLLFRDYDDKPAWCSPQDLPCYSYSSKQELTSLVTRLVNFNNGLPTSEYINMLEAQRSWLKECGTTIARARKIVDCLKEHKQKKKENKKWKTNFI